MGRPMPSHVTLYGLATCDTTRAARKWLDGQGVSYAFHDVRTGGLTRAMVEGWVKKLGWEKVLNKASTTWRELPEEAKAGLNDKSAVGLLLAAVVLLRLYTGLLSTLGELPLLPRLLQP